MTTSEAKMFGTPHALNETLFRIKKSLIVLEYILMKI